MNRKFWLSFAVTVTLGGMISHFIWSASPRPAFPIPGREYVSATRDGPTDQSLFYFNLFGFGDRLARADVVVAGSSHAEFGLNAKLLAAATDPDKQRGAFNMGLGGGESINFGASLMRRYNVHPSLLIIDPFATGTGPSQEALHVMAISRSQSVLRVFEIWSGFLRDWMLQGLFPRLTLSLQGFKAEQPVVPTIIRDWQTADVTAVYGDGGEVFSNSLKGHLIETGPEWRGTEPLASDVGLIKGLAKRTVVTAIPYPSFDESVGRKMAMEVGALFVPIGSAGLLFWDYHHLNRDGRDRATTSVATSIR